MEFVKRLGMGSCGTVDLVSITDSLSKEKTFYAAKSSKDPEMIDDLKKEERLLDIFRGCPEIVQCHGGSWSYSSSYECKNGDDDDDDESTSSWWYDDEETSSDEDESGNDEEEPLITYTIFLEYLPRGSLYDVIKNAPKGKLPEQQVRYYTKSILRGLAVIHAKGYVHLDVKPDNILVVSPQDVKIADFDMVKSSSEKDDYLKGTYQYMAPEVTFLDSGPPTDVWSLGCTVLHMLTGQRPRKFPAGIPKTEMVRQIAKNLTPPEIPKDLSPEARDFLCKCLVENPEKRWSVKMLLEHPFVAHELSPHISRIKSLQKQFMSLKQKLSSFLALGISAIRTFWRISMISKLLDSISE